MHTTRHKVSGDLYASGGYLYEFEAFISVRHDSEKHPYGSTTATEHISEPIDNSLSIFIEGKLRDITWVFSKFGTEQTDDMLEKILREAR